MQTRQNLGSHTLPPGIPNLAAMPVRLLAILSPLGYKCFYGWRAAVRVRVDAGCELGLGKSWYVPASGTASKRAVTLFC